MKQACIAILVILIMALAVASAQPVLVENVGTPDSITGGSLGLPEYLNYSLTEICYGVVDDFERVDAYDRPMVGFETGDYWEIVSYAGSSVLNYTPGAVTTVQRYGYNLTVNNGTITVFLRMDSGSVGFVGVELRWQDVNNYYRVYYSNADVAWKLIKVVAGASTTLASSTLSCPTSLTNVTILLSGSSIKVYINESLVFDVTDTQFDSGFVVFVARQAMNQKFDNLKVTLEEPIIVTETTVEVDYTVYPSYTEYNTTFTTQNFYQTTVYLSFPSDLNIISCTPSYTTRNSTHLVWQNLESGTEIALEFKSTTEVLEDFSYYYNSADPSKIPLSTEPYWWHETTTPFKYSVGTIIVNSAEHGEVYVSNSKDSGYTTILLPSTITVDTANNYYEEQFYIINQKEEHNPSVIWDDDDSVLTLLKLGTGSIDATLTKIESPVYHGSYAFKITFTDGTYENVYLKREYATSQDWSNKDFLVINWYGQNTGHGIYIRIAAPDWGNQRYFVFYDNFDGWKQLVFPLRKGEDIGTPDLSQVTAVQLCFYSWNSGDSAINDYFRTDVGQWAKCYDKETEILTLDGWKKFSELSEDDLVAQVNPETLEISYVKPLRIIKQYYKGKMYHITGKSIDLLVTPDHRIPYISVHYWERKREVKLQYKDMADLYKTTRRVYLPQFADWKGKEIDYVVIPAYKVERNGRGSYYLPPVKIRGDDFMALLGIYLAEGSTFRAGIDIAQTRKSPYWNKIKELLDRLPFNYSYSESSHRFKIYSVQLRDYFKRLGHAGDKYIPKKFKNASKRQLQILLEYYAMGDGNLRRETQWRFLSKSEKLIDDLQEILLKLGYSSTKWKQGDYYLLILRKRKTVNLRRKDIRIEYYNDYVYDVTVPTGLIVVRRNGKVVIGSNCEVMVPDNPKLWWFRAGYYNIAAEVWFWNVENNDWAVTARSWWDGKRQDYMDEDKILFLDGTDMQTMYGGADPWSGVGSDPFFWGDYGSTETAAYSARRTRTITYTKYFGAQKRWGFTIKMPPFSDYSDINKALLKLRVYYEDDGLTSFYKWLYYYDDSYHDSPPGTDKHTNLVAVAWDDHHVSMKYKSVHYTDRQNVYTINVKDEETQAYPTYDYTLKAYYINNSIEFAKPATTPFYIYSNEEINLLVVNASKSSYSYLRYYVVDDYILKLYLCDPGEVNIYSFTIHDFTGKFTNATLIIRRSYGDIEYLVAATPISLYSASVPLHYGDLYALYVSKDGDVRGLASIVADSDTTKDVYVGASIDPQHTIWHDCELNMYLQDDDIIVSFEDNQNRTTTVYSVLKFRNGTVYAEQLASGYDIDLVFQDTPVNETTLYLAVNVTHPVYGNHTELAVFGITDISRIKEHEMELEETGKSLGWPQELNNVAFRTLIAAGSVFLVGLLFSGPFLPLGFISVALLIGFYAYVGWLDLMNLVVILIAAGIGIGLAAKH